MTDENETLKGKIAIVTGSGQNIGKAIALRLGRAGAAVVVNGHSNRQHVDDVVAEIEEFGGRALAVMADVSDSSQVEEMVRTTNEHFGSVDIAVSNVGRRLHMPFLEISINNWHTVINTNLSAMFYLDRLVVESMKKKGWGRVIHISGYDGFTGHIPNRAHNIVCKAGMHGLTKAIAREFGPYGITCNTVVPGAINTQRDWSQYPNSDIEKKRNEIPVRRWGEVEDLAEACHYLISDNAGFVNGQAIHVNGGEFMF